jgi:hypothetical protein
MGKRCGGVSRKPKTELKQYLNLSRKHISIDKFDCGGCFSPSASWVILPERCRVTRVPSKFRAGSL